jgi:hypothetical protein
MKRRSGNIFERFEHAGTVIGRPGAWWCEGGRSNSQGAAARTRLEAPSTTTTTANAYSGTNEGQWTYTNDLSMREQWPDY